MNTLRTEKASQYEVIPIVVDIIVGKIKPKIIVLFGSCSRGCISHHSDIDLCIVLKGRIEPKERVKIRSVLLGNIIEITDYEVDMYICGEEEWQGNYLDQSTFIGKIYKEGKILYGGQ